jgi:hypothetical protein
LNGWHITPSKRKNETVENAKINQSINETKISKIEDINQSINRMMYEYQNNQPNQSINQSTEYSNGYYSTEYLEKNGGTTTLSRPR